MATKRCSGCAHEKPLIEFLDAEGDTDLDERIYKTCQRCRIAYHRRKQHNSIASSPEARRTALLTASTSRSRDGEDDSKPNLRKRTVARSSPSSSSPADTERSPSFVKSNRSACFERSTSAIPSSTSTSSPEPEPLEPFEYLVPLSLTISRGPSTSIFAVPSHFGAFAINGGTVSCAVTLNPYNGQNHASKPGNTRFLVRERFLDSDFRSDVADDSKLERAEIARIYKGSARLKEQHGQLNTGMEATVTQEGEATLSEKEAEIQSLRRELEEATDKIRSLEQQLASLTVADGNGAPAIYGGGRGGPVGDYYPDEPGCYYVNCARGAGLVWQRRGLIVKLKMPLGWEEWEGSVIDGALQDHTEAFSQ